jgi:2,4-dienoyl-CoA reductase-like NADH-dependent reductase (Old Yellow Enzyme family)/thioredoxin reductase
MNMTNDMKLFQPIKINQMELKNRISQAAILNAPGITDQQAITADTIEWYETRARGGAGIIITGALVPEQFGLPGIRDGLPQLAEAIHKYDCRIVVQIVVGGSMFVPFGPSAPPFPNEEDKKQSMPEVMTPPGQLAQVETPPFHEVTVPEIHAIQDQLAGCAVILKEAGIDGVQLHCTHGAASFMCCFISPYYNRRTDEYGGSWENRLRNPVETIQKMRAAVGDDYPILARIAGDELLGEQGITAEASRKYIAPALEQAGIDALDVSQGSIMHSPQGILVPMYYEQGCFLDMVATVKQGTSVPVFGAGRFTDFDFCEEALQKNQLDIINFGRQLIADPDTPNKYLAGKKEDIRPCIACTEGCGLPCTVNYDIGPNKAPLLPAGSDKKIVIIGSGVAGLEAARVAALRGYSVTLLEKRDKLGGLVGTLQNEPTCKELSLFTDYLIRQLENSDVDVKLNFDATADSIMALEPDVVIVAAGAVQDIPQRLHNNPKVVDILEAIERRDELGEKVVVWGLSYGAETAISLADEGKEVTLLGNGNHLSLLGFAANARRWYLAKKLSSDIDPVRAGEDSQVMENIDVMFQTRLGEVGENTLEVIPKGGESKTIEYDTLVVARARKRNMTLMEQLEGRVPELFAIGDYAQVNVIEKAVLRANETVRSIDSDEEVVEQMTKEPGGLI